MQCLSGDSNASLSSSAPLISTMRIVVTNPGFIAGNDLPEKRGAALSCEMFSARGNSSIFFFFCEDVWDFTASTPPKAALFEPISDGLWSADFSRQFYSRGRRITL